MKTRGMVLGPVVFVALAAIATTFPVTAQSDALHIDASGNVGIGTTTPSAELDVHAGTSGGSSHGNARVVIEDDGHAFLQFLTPNSNVSGLYFGVPADWVAAVLQWVGNAKTLALKSHTPGGQVTFSSGNNVEAVRIDSTGNVGIGTPTPAGKLDVNGAIYQRSGVLHADFVFEPDYSLRTIEEHATYMWENKHLPAVGAGRYDENGRSVLEIGASSIAMLEELEIAHIYIEQLSERLEESEALNEELRGRLARVEEALGLEKQ